MFVHICSVLSSFERPHAKTGSFVEKFEELIIYKCTLLFIL